MQQPGVRLTRIRVVVHAAGKFLAAEHHGAGPHADAVGDGSLQLSGQRRNVRAASRPAVCQPRSEHTFPLWM